jgi:hypothetical protein
LKKRENFAEKNRKSKKKQLMADRRTRLLSSLSTPKKTLSVRSAFSSPLPGKSGSKGVMNVLQNLNMGAVDGKCNVIGNQEDYEVIEEEELEND